MAQDMRHHLVVGGEPDLGLCLVPQQPEAGRGDGREGPPPHGAAFGGVERPKRAAGQRDGAAAARFGQPEAHPAVMDVVPDQPQRLAEAAAGVDQEDREPVAVGAAGSDCGKRWA